MNQENQKNMEQYFFRASAADFKKIPGSPIAYWSSKRVLDLFEFEKNIGKIVKPRQGMSTNDNKRFLRYWHEESFGCIGFSFRNAVEAKSSGLKWFPYNKGGSYRKWYGNNDLVINWLNDGEEIKDWLTNNPKDPNTSHWSRRIINTEFYYRESITWSDITTNSFAARFSPQGFLFDVKGSSAFPSSELLPAVIGLMNNKIMYLFMKILNPTVTFQVGDISRVPFVQPKIPQEKLSSIIESLISTARTDWDNYESSWDFSSLPLLQAEYRQSTLQATYHHFRTDRREMTQEMQRLEEENNRIFIEAYGLQDELSPDVPLKEITLTCNPHYRYGGDKTDAELEAQLQADTIAEFLSYAVGCMFGRYSVDKPGLVLANQGETLADYLRQVSEPRFMPDEDNVIPLLDGEWFADDVTERFRTFLRVTFGEAHYEANLAFIEQSLGKDVRKYFLKDFYANHVKRYKKRPIYWLFSSPKGTFSALIYLHRYRPDTVSVVLQYLRDLRKKLAARLDYLQQVGISTSASQGEKTRALKEVETLKKQLLELDDYERDTLYPLATEQIVLDLDNGVKANYLKLGPALKKIVGLDAKGDE